LCNTGRFAKVQNNTILVSGDIFFRPRNITTIFLTGDQRVVRMLCQKVCGMGFSWF